MGEETDIAEPMSTEDVVAAEDVTANEPSKERRRKRKKHLYKSLRELVEFYVGDVNLSKDRFMSEKIQGKPFVYVDLSLFLTFNKVRALTSNVEDLAKALSQSEILQLSEDGTQVCRKTPIRRKENEDDCTIYVEQLPPDIDHDMLIKMFSEYGTVDYVSLPRFSHNNKFKGFAFVEFKDPETAKRALEAFKIKGCCLSPQMAPGELMSIKHFDHQNKENKLEEAKIKIETTATVYNTHSNENESAGTLKLESSQESKDNDCDESSIEKHRKKRKSSDTNEKVIKRMKKSHSNETDSSTVEQSGKHIEEDVKIKDETCDKDEKEILKDIEPEVKNTKGKKKSSPKEDDQQNLSSEDKLKLPIKKQKRKHSEVEVEDLKKEVDKTDDEEGEPTRKKIKCEMDSAESEISQTDGENEVDTNKQKKKRKRKKKIKKEKSTAITRGLKVLPKKEWKALRNKYLNMQRDMMAALKQHLTYSKWEKNKTVGPESEEGPSAKRSSKPTPDPGTVVKVTLEHPVSSQSAVNAKSEMRIHPDIRYVDVTEGSPLVYLRAATPQLAASLVQSRHWPVMEIIQGDEEVEYWNKINLSREHKPKKNKSNLRGRTKLLKRVERFQGKHIAFDAT